MQRLILSCLLLAFCQPGFAQEKRRPEQWAVPPVVLSPKLPDTPDFGEDDDDEPEMSLPLKDGLAAKGKLGGSWNFSNLPGTAGQLDNFNDTKGRKLELPGLRSERHMTIGGRKSQTNGLSFGFDFDLPH